jgi:hypothetical protein
VVVLAGKTGRSFSAVDTVIFNVDFSALSMATFWEFKGIYLDPEFQRDFKLYSTQRMVSVFKTQVLYVHFILWFALFRLPLYGRKPLMEANHQQ